MKIMVEEKETTKKGVDLNSLDEFNIGKRGITVEMDRSRELIFDLGSFRFIEDLAQRWIKKAGINVRDIVGPQNIPVPQQEKDGTIKMVPVFNPAILTTGHIIANLGIDNFLTIALMGAILHDYRKDRDKLTTELADSIYEAYLEKEGDRNDLVEILAEAYGRARNPHRLKQIREQRKMEESEPEIAPEDSGGDTSSDSDLIS